MREILIDKLHTFLTAVVEFFRLNVTVLRPYIFPVLLVLCHQQLHNQAVCQCLTRWKAHSVGQHHDQQGKKGQCNT